MPQAPTRIGRGKGSQPSRPKFLTRIPAMYQIYDEPEVMLDVEDLRGYQLWMSDKIVDEPAVYLAADMGLGKTGASLYAAHRLLRRGEVGCILVVAPVNVAENTWPEEIQKWEFAWPHPYTVITGTEEQRIAALEQGGEIHIVNRENLVWLHHYWGRRWPYDMLIYDEGRRLASGKVRTAGTQRQDGTVGPQRLSEFGTLVRMRWSFNKVVILSGTPTPEGLTDLWGPIYICDEGYRLGTKVSHFRERWFSYDKAKYKWNALPWAEEEILDEIRDIFFTLSTEDYLDLPELITQDHHVYLPTEAKEVYDRLKREMVLREFDLEAVNGGVLTNKLLQLANGSLYLEDGSSKRIHEAKIDSLRSIMLEADGPVLVAYSYKFDREAIAKAFKDVRIFGENRDDLRDWNKGRIRMLLTHPASAGHGMNFQYGGNIGVWYGLPWSLELYLQFMKRLHRSGQQAESVVMHRILAHGTVDFSLAKTLRRKKLTQDDIIAAVKADVAQYKREMRIAV
jgi:SNF2 family DNA or RNA helicase